MGHCYMQLTISCNDRDKVETSKLAIAHYCAALQYEQEQEQRFVDKVVSEVTAIVRYVQTDMYQKEDQHCLINEMEIFSKFSFLKDKHNHPIFAVITGAYLNLGFKYYDLVVKVTNKRDFVKSRHYLQSLYYIICKVDAYTHHQEKPSPEDDENRKLLKEEYTHHQMIVSSMDFLKEGSGMCEDVKREMKKADCDIEEVLHHAWSALDRLREAERLAEGRDDQIYFEARR